MSVQVRDNINANDQTLNLNCLHLTVAEDNTGGDITTSVAGF